MIGVQAITLMIDDAYAYKSLVETPRKKSEQNKQTNKQTNKHLYNSRKFL
jgi:hypothetical protein